MKTKLIIVLFISMLSVNIIANEYPSAAREQFILGYKYYNGDGVEKDFRKAIKLWGRR